MMDYPRSREHIVRMCRSMLQRGFLKATEGNVSVRIPGHSRYAITPSNYDYDRMRAEDVAIVDFAGRSATTTLAPSIECAMHAAIYQQRPDVHAIVHTHQVHASALAILRKPIPALTDEQVRFLGRQVPIISYAPAGTSLLAAKVGKAVTSGGNAYLIANHGVVVLGDDPDRAVFNMALLEKAAIAYLQALTTESGKVYTIPRAVREIAFRTLRQDQRRIAAQLTAPVQQPPSTEPGGAELPSADTAAATWLTRQAEKTPTSSPPQSGDQPGGPESAELGYAISSYPDVPEIMRRLTALLAQPVRGLRPAALAEVLAYYHTKCRASKVITDRAKTRIPGGVQHNLAFNYPFPLAMTRAEGAQLWDLDGNTYIDLLQAGGTTLLGSNYPPVREAVTDVIRTSGPVTGLFHEYELKLAEIINRYMPHIQSYRAVGSGTEAVMAAVRGARAYTGHTMVVKVGGAFHGWSDTMVYGLRVPGSYRMYAKGIPFGATWATRETFPHSIRALRRKLIQNRLRGGTAAVIVEPIGPESGTRPAPRDFNAQVRQLCDEFGALLVFDEVVTAFRLGMGGAAGYFGVQPDLTVFGKAVAGGYPMAGGVGGPAEIMQVFGSGLGHRSGAQVQIGGTLSANPLSCAAGYFAIQEMARTNAPVVAGRAGDRLTAGLQHLLAKYHLPYVAYNTGSIVHLECSGVMLLNMRHPVKLARENKARKLLMEQMGAAYASYGLITLAGSRLYTSMACTDTVIDEALHRFDQVFAMVEGV